MECSWLVPWHCDLWDFEPHVADRAFGPPCMHAPPYRGPSVQLPADLAHFGERVAHLVRELDREVPCDTVGPRPALDLRAHQSAYRPLQSVCDLHRARCQAP